MNPQRNSFNRITPARVHSALNEMFASTGIMPSTREIQTYLHASSQTSVVRALKALEVRGVIQRKARAGRGIMLRSITCPHCNRSIRT